MIEHKTISIPATLDLNKLRTFLAVVDAGGISAAATGLGLTRSAISQSVSALERSLDVRLFNRVGRRLVLTQEGRSLARRFRRQQEQLARAIEEITSSEREMRGSVRLGLFQGAAREPLARFVAGFLDQHDRVQVKLLYGSHAELTAGLLEGRLDFALALQPTREARTKLASTRLYRQQLVAVSRDRVTRGDASFEQLRELPLIDYYQSSPLFERWFRHHFARRFQRERVRAWAASTDLVLELVSHGAGIGVVPRYVADPHLSEGRLSLIRTGKPDLEDTIWLEQPAGAWQGPALAAFRSALLAAFADHG